MAVFNYTPFGLSTSMFTKVLELMGTAEQKEKWLVPAQRGQINGAYVQTELGHGTFLRGLETRAVFDAARDSFVISTPTLSSTKFWPGALGYSTTHGIVMARLITDSGGSGRKLKGAERREKVSTGHVRLKPFISQRRDFQRV